LIGISGASFQIHYAEIPGLVTFLDPVSPADVLGVAEIRSTVFAEGGDGQEHKGEKEDPEHKINPDVKFQLIFYLNIDINSMRNGSHQKMRRLFGKI
jgi:hypothetical protein